jgi:hypothetical protein
MIKEYIKNKAKNHFSISGIQIIIRDPVSNEINLPRIVKKLSTSIPHHLLINIKKIIFGQFEEMLNRELTAMYKDSTIFVDNRISDENDLIDDLIHEVSHSVEELYNEIIYSDGKVEEEFVSKRKKLYTSLENKGFKILLSDFLNIQYNVVFDNFLYKEVGYSTLSVISSNIFYSPYAATSLREYYANGFESFYMREDIPRLKKISPQLYKKLLDLLNYKDGHWKKKEKE